MEIDKVNERDNAQFPELDLQRMQEDPSHMEPERCCGNCCWFCFEQTDGEGQCPAIDGGLLFPNCATSACKDYVSREEIRHYMAVLLQATRFCKDPTLYYMPKSNDIIEAQAFAYKYMKVFSKL